MSKSHISLYLKRAHGLSSARLFNRALFGLHATQQFVENRCEVVLELTMYSQLRPRVRAAAACNW
jgi:hypothetical protein